MRANLNLAGPIDKANEAGYTVKKPKKPCHAFRVLYATRRHQHGVDIETLRQELGHSDITTTQIYLRSVNTKSDRHSTRINEADRFSMAPGPKAAVRREVAASNYASVSIGGPSLKEGVASVQ